MESPKPTQIFSHYVFFRIEKKKHSFKNPITYNFHFLTVTSAHERNGYEF